MPTSEMECFIMGVLSVVYFGSLFIAYLKYLENRQLEKENRQLEKKILETQRKIDSKNKDKRG